MTAARGRRPADRATPGRQEVWTALRALAGAAATAAELGAATGANRKTLLDYLACLEAGGFILRVEAGDGAAPASWRLVRDAGFHAPRLRRDGTPVTQGAGVENMWRSMRMLAQFSARDLAVHSTTDSVSVSLATAKSYTAILLRSGYLRVVQKASPARGRLAVYRLVRNSGPRPPQVQRVKQVFDPNTGEVHPAGERA